MMTAAQAYNAAQWGSLWRHPELPEPLRSLEPTSQAFVDAVFEFQARAGLATDGKLGPATLRALLAPQSSPSTLWPLTPGFRPTKRWKRPKPPRAIVIHDTVSHTARSAYRTLEANGYGTHFFVDLDGTLVTCLDPVAEAAAHASGWNDCSVGIDVVAILDPKRANATERARMVERSWSASVKAPGKVIDYTEPQKRTLVALVRQLCDVLAIPHFVPSALTGYGTKIPTLRGETYRGVLAHAQTSTKRWDGLLGVELLIADGFETE